VGIGHDGMCFFPEDHHFSQYRRQDYQLNSRKGMLCINHEFGTNDHVLGKTSPETIDDVRFSQHVHGVSVVALQKSRYYEE